MTSPLISRFAKPLLLTCACTVIGFGMVDHASAQKGNTIKEVSGRSSGFFSFELLSPSRPLIMAAMTAGLQDPKAFRDVPAMQAYYSARNGHPDWVEIY